MNRESRVTIRFSETEFQKVYAAFAKTTHRRLAGYLRNIILDKPVTVYTRNQSYDEFVTGMLGLRGELNAIGNNINQAVKKLHVLKHDGEIKTWALIHQKNQETLFKKVAEIESKISKISAQWSQE